MATFWLSFADPERPPGQQFIGAAIVEADSAQEAVQRAWRTGCNPGGEIALVKLEESDEIPSGKMAALMLAPRDRLLDMAAIEAYGLGDD